MLPGKTSFRCIKRRPFSPREKDRKRGYQQGGVKLYRDPLSPALSLGERGTLNHCIISKPKLPANAGVIFN